MGMLQKGTTPRRVALIFGYTADKVNKKVLKLLKL